MRCLTSEADAARSYLRRHVNVIGMYEVLYATTRVALVEADTAEMAKRRFAAYVLYDRYDYIRSDVQLTVGDDAEVAPFEGDAPLAGSRADMRAWVAHRDAQVQPFEVGLFEDSERSLDAYLRLLATNDPWRLEGHGSLGIQLSLVPLFADLVTFDGRISYRFEATQFFDYLRFDMLASLDPLRPHESIRIESLIDVSALHDAALRQVASSYTIIAGELRLTERYSAERPAGAPFSVTLAVDSWQRYVAHRIAEPHRFLPPAGWRSAFPTYDGDGDLT